MNKEELHKLNTILFDSLDEETYIKVIEYYKQLVDRSKQLIRNWNKLKDDIINIQQTYFAWDEILDKMEELENGDSNDN